jgi:glyoxylase-like metal-dependent hydrolase (beta-lactamase superfamily II)
LKYLEIPDNVNFDIFGDGTLVTVHTPGHTPGHQSLVVTLPDYDNPLFLCQDACYMEENLAGVSYSAGLMWCLETHFKTIDLIRYYQGIGHEIWFGHEMESWVKNIAKFI